MNRLLMVCLAVLLTASWAQVSHAWSFGAELKSTVNNNSNNNSSIHGSTFTNSGNRTDNRKSDNSRRSDDDISNSYNSYDQRSFDLSNHSVDASSWTDSSITDAYKGNTFEDSQGKRVASHDIGGDARNSIFGNLEQKIGSDFSGLKEGNSGVYNASVTNTQTFGDVTIGATPTTDAK